MGRNAAGVGIWRGQWSKRGASGQGCMQFLQPPPSSLPVAATVATVPEEAGRAGRRGARRRRSSSTRRSPSSTKPTSASPAPSRSKKRSRPSTRRPNRARRWSAASGGVAAAPAVGDLFERIRSGFVHRRRRPRRRRARSSAGSPSHPDYLDRTFKRGERYLYHIVKRDRSAQDAARAGAAAGRRERVQSRRVLAGARFRPVAIHSRHRPPLRPEAELVLRRTPRRRSRRPARRSTICSSSPKSSMATGCSPSRRTTAAKRTSRAQSRRNRAAGKPTDFFSLKLPRETRAYVPKLLAMRRIVARPGRARPGVRADSERAVLRADRRRRADRPARRGRARRAGAGRAARAQSCVQSLGHRSGRPAPAAGAGRSRGEASPKRSPRCRRRSACASSITTCARATRSAASPTSTACRSRRSRPRTRFAAR